MQDKIEVTAEELQLWRENKITEYLFSELEDTKNGLKEHLGNGGTLGNEIETAKTVGQIQGINQAYIVVGVEEPENG